MRKYLYLIILIFLVLIGYNYLYKNHRDITIERPEFVLSSTSLMAEFSNNPSEAGLKYLNKTIEVSGVVSEVNENNLTLTEQVFCQFSENINSSTKVDSQIKVKGRLIGFDDLLEEIKLDQCSIIIK